MSSGNENVLISTFYQTFSFFNHILSILATIMTEIETFSSILEENDVGLYLDEKEEEALKAKQYY